MRSMPKGNRQIKVSPPGKLARGKVRKAISAIHVYPSSKGEWQVKQIGLMGVRKRFPSKDSAVAFAKHIAEPALLLKHGKSELQ